MIIIPHTQSPDPKMTAAILIAIYLVAVTGTVIYNAPKYYKAATGKLKYWDWTESHSLLIFLSFLYLAMAIISFISYTIYSYL